MVNLKSSVFLFIGDDNYLKEKAIKDLSSSLLDSSSRELDYKIFYGSEADSREILDYVNTVPFLASRRLAVIKDFEKLSSEDKTRLISYIKKPSKLTCLVLDAKDDSILKEYGQITKYVNVQRFDGLREDELSSWIRQFFALRLKKIDAGAVDDLKELQGENLSTLAQEIEKLITFIGEKEDAKVSDVEEVIGKNIMRSAFELTRAVGEKNVESAIDIISGLVLSGKKHYEIIGLLCWHFKRILKAKALQAKHEPDYRIAGMLNIKKSYFDEFFKQTRRFTSPQIKSKMEVLLEADLDIKRTKFDPSLVLEFAVIRLCLN